MPHPALVLIPNRHGGFSHYDVKARNSMDAAAMAMTRHPVFVADREIIAVIVEGVGPLVEDWKQRNADKATFFVYAGRVRAAGKSTLLVSPPSLSNN
jgi:NADPH:quinone reductase-like Zn-dependent oxidoreductase